MDTCICMAESLHFSPEMITILATPQYKIKNSKVKKKNNNKDLQYSTGDYVQYLAIAYNKKESKK